METLQIYQYWIRQVIVPYYRLKSTAEDVTTFDLWAEDFFDRKVSIDQLNNAFKAWRRGPNGDYPPNAANLLKIIYPPEMGTAAEALAKRELGKLQELTAQAYSDLLHHTQLNEDFCQEFNKKYGLHLPIETLARLRNDFTRSKADCDAARNEIQYYLSRSK